MPRSLPSTPSVRFLQTEAKDILKTHKGGDVSCCPTLRYHFRFSRAADEEILKAEVTLQEVQHALALDYGFKGWKDLKAHAESVPAVKAGTDGDDAAGKAFKTVVLDAVADKATDLHLEPMDTGIRVRRRVDGVLYEAETLDEAPGQARRRGGDAHGRPSIPMYGTGPRTAASTSTSKTAGSIAA